MKPLGLPFAASVALHIASDVLGIDTRPKGRRDQKRVRGLASLMLDTTGASWADITTVVYGTNRPSKRLHGRNHSTAYTGAILWQGTPEGDLAVDRFRKLLERDQ